MPLDCIGKNLEYVKNRVKAACLRAGRDPAGVTLVAVVKTVGPAEVRALYGAGVRDFGENRVADALAKMETLNLPDARWHMIGHLQRNKAEMALHGFTCIHSVESVKLVDALVAGCAKRGLKLDVLAEVNVSGEESKYGVSPTGLPELLAAISRRPELNLRGLMTMAPLSADPGASRPVFKGLRLLRDRMEAELGIRLPELSMGMSGDFETAVEEGATLIRVGTALFAESA